MNDKSDGAMERVSYDQYIKFYLKDVVDAFIFFYVYTQLLEPVGCPF